MNILGLMAIPPNDDKTEEYFKSLSELNSSLGLKSKFRNVGRLYESIRTQIDIFKNWKLDLWREILTDFHYCSFIYIVKNSFYLFLTYRNTSSSAFIIFLCYMNKNGTTFIFNNRFHIII